MTPTRKGLLWVERLNEILQKYLNPEEPKRRSVRLTAGCSVKVTK